MKWENLYKVMQDENLYKAVLTGHSIHLTGNILRENRLKQEAEEQAKLEEEIRDLINLQRRPVANLNEFSL